MRSFLASLALGLAVATAASAHMADDTSPMRPAGVLTCSALEDASLVFGQARPAACSFVDAAGGAATPYVALLPPRVAKVSATPGLLVWRVTTEGGHLRPGMLDGAFDAARPGLPLRGTSAGLEPVGETAEPSLLLAVAVH